MILDGSIFADHNRKWIDLFTSASRRDSNIHFWTVTINMTTDICYLSILSTTRYSGINQLFLIFQWSLLKILGNWNMPSSSLVNKAIIWHHFISSSLLLMYLYHNMRKIDKGISQSSSLSICVDKTDSLILVAYELARGHTIVRESLTEMFLKWMHINTSFKNESRFWKIWTRNQSILAIDDQFVKNMNGGENLQVFLFNPEKI